jgi:hypothetical protein
MVRNSISISWFITIFPSKITILFGYPIAIYPHQIQLLKKLPSFWPQFQVDDARLRIHGQRPLTCQGEDVDSAF